MATSEQVNIIIKAMATQAISELNKLDGTIAKTTKTSKTSESAFKALSSGWAKAAVAAGTLYVAYTKLIKPASDLEEQINKFNVVFAGHAEVAEHAAQVLSNSYGLSQRAAREYMSTLGSMLKSMGMSTDASARMSSSMVQLGVDMSSFHNVNTEEVMTAFRSAISGEFEPMKRFGVLLTEATVKAEALRLGLYRGTGAIDAQARATASLNIITRSQVDAIGDFARTSDSLANQIRIADARIEDVSAKLGGIFLPAIRRAMSGVNEAILGFGALIAQLTSLGSQGTTSSRVVSHLGNAFATTFRSSLAVATYGLSEFLMRLGQAEEANRRWQAMGVHGLVTTGARGILAGARGPAGARPPGGSGGGGGRARSDSKPVDSDMQAIVQMQEEYTRRTLEQSGNRMALLNAEYTNAINQAQKIGADTAQIEAFYREERRRLEQEDYMARLQEAQEFMGGMSGIWSQMGGIVNQYFTNKSMALNNDMAKEKKAVQNSKMTEEEKKKALEEIDAKYEKKRAELARKQAKFEKVNAIITATINTAQAVTKALGQGGFFGGPAMAAFVGALGAAQIALIAKQPLPEAAQGGIISGSQAGTILRAGEGGRSEAIIPFENPAAMEKLGGMGNTVNVNVQYLFSNDDVPMEIAEKIDRALYRLQQRGNSRFASSMG